MFRCVCYTCEVRTTHDEWADAQQTFNEHAGDRHEVVLEREPSVDGLSPESPEETTESGATARSASDGPSAGDG